MTDFTVTRSRDAFGVIRGFVYQVDVTIDRWLDLPPDVVLELERGEDIDTVAGALAADGDLDRMLEQVKYRDRKLTLRSPEAVEAIANAIDHLNANPGKKLRFQFTTNASPAIERPTPLADRVPAILAWGLIATKEWADSQAETAIAAIKSILVARPKPENIPDASWALFRAVMEAQDNAPLRTVMEAFIWNVKVPDAPSIRLQLQRKLIQLDLAGTTAEAVHRYQKLFLHVLTKLTQAGAKALTAQDLHNVLQQPDFANEIIGKVFGRIESIEDRMEAIEEKQESDRRSLENKIEDLARSKGVTAVVSYAAAVPTLQPADPPLLHCQRVETVGKLLPKLQGRSWFGLTGPPGTGKSELARLLAGAWGGIRAWIDLRALNGDQACLALDTAVRTIVGNYLPNERRAAYSSLAARTGQGTLVVDDLPLMAAGDHVAVRLLDLINSCRTNGSLVVTTSIYPPPTWLTDRLLADSMHVEMAPPLADSEAQELFQLYGAPGAWLGRTIISTINSAAGGHVTLLIAGIRYLRNRKWEMPEGQLAALVNGEMFKDLRRETIQRLLQLVADGSTRDLLYRANIAITEITETELHDLAAVPQALTRPAERTQELIDVCILRAPGGGLRVSPMFKALGTADVPAVTAEQCHAVLGHSIVRRQRISTTEAVAAVTHFLSAKDVDRAGLVLLRSLIALNELRGKVDAGLLTILWRDKPLPEMMDLGIRLTIRANQARLYAAMKRSTAYTFHDLEQLMQQATAKEAWAVLAAGVTVQSALSDSDLIRANRMLIRALKMRHHVDALLGENGQNGISQIEGLLWFNATKVKNTEELYDWVASVDSLDDSQRSNLVLSELTNGAAWHLADQTWMWEADLPTEQRDWTRALNRLESLRQAAARWKSPMLEACCVRGQIIVIAEYQHNLHGARDLATQSLHSGRFANVAAYSIQECMGRQYLYQKDSVEARQWLVDALKTLGSAWPNKRVYTLLNLARTVDTANALAALQEAVSIAESDPDTPRLDAVRAQGELALAYWSADNHPACVQALDAALTHLLLKRDTENTLWRATAAMLGHYIGYFGTVLTTGTPPSVDEDGNPYAQPHIGLLTTPNLKLADWLKPGRISFYIGMVAIMAESLGMYEIAERRGIEALDTARADNALMMTVSAGRSHAMTLIVSDRLPEAIDLALQSSTAAKALSIIRAQGGDLYATNRSAEQIIGVKPSSSWNEAESNSLLLGVFPVFLRLGVKQLTNDPNASSLASETIAALEAVREAASDKDLWNDCVTMFKKVFKESLVGRELVAAGNEQKKRGRSTLQALAYLGATLQGDATPEISVKLHLNIFAESRYLIPTDWPAYERLALPFLETYWERVFREQPYRFTAPALYRDLFQEARARAIKVRAQAILRIVFQGLNIPIPSAYREWLSA